MENLTIYKNGHVDTKATLKLKLDLVLDRYKQRAIQKLLQVDDYFVNH